MSKQNYIVYTYRYMWKIKDNKNVFNVKFVTGAIEEHKRFMGLLQKDENVISATRIYVNEINVSLTEQHEFVKKEIK